MPDSAKRKKNREEFINHIEALTRNWLITGQEDELSTEQIVDGVVFSVLNAIDQDYRLYPDEKRNLNIAGSLHEEWAGRCKNHFNYEN
ncbi:hypothetical protein [Cytobacillus oceanisediminis]|uniref:hypothetical protein n=1 Tax=Cytobacillus oceanisediminis TaxID=665099 RepID=UPI001FB1D128|nr:hypothetical protein [Cytobacillus oceanisediminis]UOE58021.1 hypothetical protein IRB79_27545 [Cytobacillus oceanisediminis]